MEKATTKKTKLLVEKKEELSKLDTHALIYELLAERVGAVDPKDVLYAQQIKSGKDAGKWTVVLGGKRMTVPQANALRGEAQALSKFQIWKVFQDTLTHEANLRMFKQAKTERDLDWGKAILHAASIFATILAAAEGEHIDS